MSTTLVGATELVIVSLLACGPTFAQNVNIDAVRDLCTKFGYPQSSIEHANCVERLFKESLQQQNQQRTNEQAQRMQLLQQTCATAREQAAYWCGRMHQGGGFLAGHKCAESQSNVRQLCM